MDGGHARRPETEDAVSEDGGSDYSAASVVESTASVESKGRCPRKGAWLLEEDELLRKVLEELGGASAEVHSKWSTVASRIPGRSAKQCRERWCYNLDPSICKGPWTGAEDEILISSHATLGNRWAHIASKLPGRTENSVKSRFKSLARAQKRAWSPEEDAAILRMHHKVGCKWAVIAELLSNRTKNAVKTRYRTLVREGVQLSQPKQTQDVIKSADGPASQVSSLLNKRSRTGGLFLEIDDCNNAAKRAKVEAVSETGLILQALEQRRQQEQEQKRPQANLSPLEKLLTSKTASTNNMFGATPAWTPRSGSAAVNALLGSLPQQSYPLPLVSPRSFEALTSKSFLSAGPSPSPAVTSTPQTSPLNSPVLTPQISPRACTGNSSLSSPAGITGLISQLLELKRKQEQDAVQQQIVDLSLALLKSKSRSDSEQAKACVPNSSEVMGMSAMLALAGSRAD